MAWKKFIHQSLSGPHNHNGDSGTGDGNNGSQGGNGTSKLNANTQINRTT